MKRLIYLFIVMIALSGCATIQSHNRLEQPEGKILTASIGSTIFRMNKSSDLPNVFGKADLYGGKVDKGYTELKFKGVKENGNLILQIADINNASTETTMDRYKPFDRNKISVSANNTINIGENTAPDQTIFEFDPKKEKTLTIGGVNVEFVEVTTYSVHYKLVKQY